MSASNTADLLISGSSDKGRVKDAINNIEATDIPGSLPCCNIFKINGAALSWFCCYTLYIIKLLSYIKVDICVKPVCCI